MRKALILCGVALAVVGTALAGPASAATSSTTLTVLLTAGSLSISAPATASLSGSAAAGTVITGPLGSTATSVTDGTGSLMGWKVTAVTNGNLVSAGTPADAIPLSATGPLAVATGTVTSTGLLTGVTAPTGGFLSTTATTLLTAVAGSGGATYTYTPTLTLTMPANTKLHTDYQTVITQSVS